MASKALGYSGLVVENLAELLDGFVVILHLVAVMAATA
jgi:hypothetical protein